MKPSETRRVPLFPLKGEPVAQIEAEPQTTLLNASQLCSVRRKDIGTEIGLFRSIPSVPLRHPQLLSTTHLPLHLH